MNPDGLTGEEGTFVICSFWLVSCLAQGGRARAGARQLFDQLAGYANDLGLLAEEIDTAQRRAARQLPAGVQPHRPDHRRAEIDKAQGDGDERMSDYDVIVHGRRAPPASTARASWPRAACASRSSSASCVGGECSYWACIPSKTLLRPGEALRPRARAPGAREAVTRRARRRAARFAWRDFMVRDYDDSGQVEWAEGARASTVLRGAGRIAGPGTVEVGDETHTAEHIVIATGSDPVIPPIDGPARARGRVDEPRGDRP